MKLCRLCKTGSLGAFACSRHRSRRYQRLWQRRVRPRLSTFFTEIPGYSFEVGQLQGRAVPGSEPKLLVSHLTAFAYM